MSLRGVVFDLDGTLVASMHNHWRSYVTVFREHLPGLTPPEFIDVCLLEGKRAAEVIQLLARRQGREIGSEEMRMLGEVKQRTFRSLGYPDPYPGARDLLALLKRQGLKVGLATGTNRQNAEHMLGETMRLFDVTITGEDVVHSKPDPEPYLSAFRKLDLRASEAAVVENAPLGLQSARASGARVLAVAHTLPPDRLQPADAVVPDLAGAMRVLREWSA